MNAQGRAIRTALALCLLPAIALADAVDPEKLSTGQAAALLAKFEFFTERCGGRLTGDALQGVLARVLRDNALGIKAYEYNVLAQAEAKHGNAQFCSALGKSLGAVSQ